MVFPHESKKRFFVQGKAQVRPSKCIEVLECPVLDLVLCASGVFHNANVSELSYCPKQRIFILKVSIKRGGTDARALSNLSDREAGRGEEDRQDE